jgi:hypothetical protein
MNVCTAISLNIAHNRGYLGLRSIMVAVYPNSVRQYTAQVDLVNTIIADHVNSLQQEVKKIEEVIGSAATSQNPLTSTWTGSFSQATSWGTLYDRIANIEAGLISGVTGLLPTIVRGDLIIGSGTSTLSRLSLGANGTVLTSNGTTATWVAPTTSFVSQSNGTVSAASTSSGVVRNVWTSTSAPTSGQGADGDVWLVYV